MISLRSFFLTILILLPLLAITLIPGGVGATPADEWHVQVIDSALGQWGGFPSIAIDSQGTSLVSYCDYDLDDASLMLATRQGEAWSIQQIDAGGVGPFSNLALDADDHPHIVYYDSVGDSIKYTWNDGSTWHFASTAAGEIARYISMALDTNGHPHIAYYSLIGQNIKYAFWNGAAWTVQNVDTIGKVDSESFRSVSIAVDSQNRPHISYFHEAAHHLKYANWDGAVWQTQWVDTQEVRGKVSSLALDANDYARIAYRDDTNDRLRYVAWDGSSWQFESIDWNGNVGWYPSLVIAADGSSRVAYRDIRDGMLRYAHRDAQGWHYQTVDGTTEDDVAYYIDLALNDDYPVIVHYDWDLQAVRYVYLEPPPPTATPTVTPTNSPTPTATPFTLYLPLLMRTSASGLSATQIGTISEVTALLPPKATDSHNTEPGHWVSGFGIPYVRGFVREMIEDKAGVIYAAGTFDDFGSLTVHNIARWDGHVWSPLGEGVDGGIYALALDQQENLYVAGNFTRAGGQPANYIARWDGSQWHALGSGLNDKARAIAIDAAGHVYVAGEFTRAGGKWVNHVAKWDGETWSAVGGGVPDKIGALTLDGQGNLYAATDPGVIINNNFGDVRMWDGETWTTISGAANMWINALTVDDAGSVYAGGDFTTLGGVAMPHIARWNGATWTAPGGGMDGMVSELKRDAQGTIYASGEFRSAGGAPVTYVARWDGSYWQQVGEDLHVYPGEHMGVYALSVTPDARLSIWYLAFGYQLQAGNWQSLPIPGNGMSDYVLALAKDGGGQFYAGGRFLRAGNQIALRVAHWNGVHWGALSQGLNGEVDALATDDQGVLYAGGVFTATGQLPLSYIARWDGQAWSNVGGGMDNEVWALLTDHEGNLYAGGAFEHAGGVAAQFIAKWDGQQWAAMGDDFNRPVTSLVIGADGALYAGGWFDNVITVNGHTEHLNGVARWDGQQWRGLDDGLAEPTIVDALAIDGAGNLYAGGAFTRISHGNVPANQVARWDGQQWQTLGSGVAFVGSSYYPATVSALAVDSQGVLYAGGLFNRAGGQPANYIARWDGSHWAPLGAGLDGPATQWFNWAYALLLLDDGQLFVGGHFDTAGEISSRNIALWSQRIPLYMPLIMVTR